MLKKSMSLLSLLAGFVLAGVIFTACTQTVQSTPAVKSETPIPGATTPAAAAWEQDWQQTVTNAKNEGKLMIYSSQSGTLIQGTGDAFNQKFGIQVDYVSARGEELMQKMRTENAAGLYLADVIVAGTVPMIPDMKPAGLLGNLRSALILPEVVDPHAWINDSIPFMDKDGTGFAMVSAYERYILRNIDMTKEGEINSYKDILDPRWKGKMVLGDPTIGGTSNGWFTILATDIWGLEPTKEYLRQLVKQEPVIQRDRRLQAEWVARGKYPLSAGTHFESAVEFVRNGSPVAFVKVAEGSKVGPGGGGLAIVARSPHPNAAKVFANWILSKEGTASFVKLYGRPGSRKDAPREGISPESFPDPDEKVYTESEEYIRFQPEMMKIAAEIFAPILK